MISKELEKQIVELYSNEDITQKEVAERCNVHPKTIKRVLLKHKIDTKYRNYYSSKCKDNPFIEGEQAEYWLGYLIADGNIASQKNKISICTVSDPDHLIKFRDYVNPEMNIYTKPTSQGTTYYTTSFSNKYVKDWLYNIGITPKKSRTIKLAIPLTNHIIRGVFDGDGSVDKRGRQKITSGSIEFIEQIQETLLQQGIRTNVYTKGNAYDMYILGDKYLFYNYLYNDATVFLERKKLRMEAYSRDVVRKLGELLENLEVDNQQPS